jgi:hypothetical protein
MLAALDDDTSQKGEGKLDALYRLSRALLTSVGGLWHPLGCWQSRATVAPDFNRVALPHTGICLPISRPPGRPLWTFWKRLPPNDGPCLFPGFGIVRDAGEATPQFYGC